jgi:PRTRC genetic system protein E
MFVELSETLENVDLVMNISKKDGNIIIAITPKSKKGADLNLAPIIVNGEAKEIDEKLPEVIADALKKNQGFITKIEEFNTSAEEEADKSEDTKGKKKSGKKDDKKEEPKADIQAATPDLFKDAPELPTAKKAKTEPKQEVTDKLKLTEKAKDPVIEAMDQGKSAEEIEAVVIAEVKKDDAAIAPTPTTPVKQSKIDDELDW